MRDSDQAIRDYDVSFYMISADTIEDNTLFAAKNDARFPILSNPELDTIRDYGVLVDEKYAKRWTFYISKQGIITYIDKSVDVRNAGRDITKNLKSLNLQDT
ncbi:MAG: redoxin domain-containing protein [Betaproteobacteria bacterium]